MYCSQHVQSHSAERLQTLTLVQDFVEPATSGTSPTSIQSTDTILPIRRCQCSLKLNPTQDPDKLPLISSTSSARVDKTVYRVL